MPEKRERGWIGVDLDGTLARYDGWRGAVSIGAPLWPMVARVKRWLAQGREVRIFTARVGADHPPAEVAQAKAAIVRWCRMNLGRELPVTAAKDSHLVEIWDDRAVAVEHNTGRVLKR